jgi:hypothetical protein
MSKRKQVKPRSSGKTAAKDEVSLPAPRRFSKKTMAGWIAEDVAAEKLSSGKS